MWSNTNSSYARRVVAFGAMLFLVSQFYNSFNLTTTLVEESIAATADPQRVQKIRQQAVQLLEAKKSVFRQSTNTDAKVETDKAQLLAAAHKAQVEAHKARTEAKLQREAQRAITTLGKEGPKATEDTAAATDEKKNDGESAKMEEKEGKKKPLNILILYPDDWRHDDIGGVAPVVRTPFLNELARDGIRFTHNMVTTSICWVSRATLFTGQYVSRHKSYRLRTPEFYKTWQNLSWPSLLQQKAGYFTGHVGKWQFYDINRTIPTLFNYSDIFDGKHQYSVNKKVMSAAAFTQRQVQGFLDKRPKDRPFALTAAFFPPKAIGNSKVPGGQWSPQNSTRQAFYGDNVTIPHPYNETEAYKKMPPFFHSHERISRSRYLERYDGEERYQASMKNYYSLITEVDEACRGIVNSLEKEGILNDTLIIFTTDNGLFHSEHGLAGKWYPFQESIRVPLIIRDPRMPQEKRNTLDGSLTLNIDLNPTILAAAGIEPPASVQGRNMAELYLPPEETDDKDGQDNTDNNSNNIQAQWRDEFLYEFPLEQGSTFPTSAAVVRKDIKYMYWPQWRYEQLFNLTEDPLELNDLHKESQYASILKELRERYAEWVEAVK